MAEKLNLVTGACGFSGSHLVRHLLAAGEKVIATDLEKAFAHPKNRFIFERIGLDFAHPNCTVVPSDLLQPASLDPLWERDVTHVFHTASLYDYSAPMEVLRRINIEGSIPLFERACAKPSLRRFVHWSTCGVFGKPYTPADGRKCNVPFSERSSSPRNAPFEQDQPSGTHLVNDYSVTKWKQEQIAWKYHRERGLPLTVVRPAPMYGPGSDYGHGGIVIAIHRGLLPLIPLDARNYITSSVHVDDMAHFAHYVADRADTLGEDYDVVDDSVISYYEFVRYLALLLGRRPIDLPLLSLRQARPLMSWLARTWLALERRWGIPRVRVFEVGSAEYISSSYWIANDKSKQIGFVYGYADVRSGMRETIEWFRDVGWLDPRHRPQAIWPQNLTPRSAEAAPRSTSSKTRAAV